MFMSSSWAGLRSRKRGAAFLMRGAESVDSLKGLFTYLVQKPLAAVAALWITCFPLLYIALYGDLVQSARALAIMTVTFVTFLMIFIMAMLSVSFLVFCVFELRRRRHLGTGSARGRHW
jgi:hypothetical protein